MEMEGGTGYSSYSAPQPGLPQPGTDYPGGEFNPALWKDKPPIEVWAHDDTVVAGKTYRYKMRYKIKNPIFSAGNVAEPPTLSDVFALASPYSQWSSEVIVPSLVNFFVFSSKSPNSNSVRFEVFRWHEGQQRSEQFTVGPGDVIGGREGDVDYPTDWTVVDFREDPRINNDWQIMLLNQKDGSIAVRSYSTDRNDTLYKALKTQIQQAKTADAGGPGVAPGGAPVLR